MNNADIDKIRALLTSVSESMFAEGADALEEFAKFEDDMVVVLCDIAGKHDIGPDQCGIPEHDLCYACRRSAVELGLVCSGIIDPDGRRLWDSPNKLGCPTGTGPEKQTPETMGSSPIPELHT